tara:strand:+ start:1964 stop:2176 length:213 start_codon:yes stop_codon:yes gene_type:complete
MVIMAMVSTAMAANTVITTVVIGVLTPITTAQIGGATEITIDTMAEALISPTGIIIHGIEAMTQVVLWAG